MTNGAGSPANILVFLQHNAGDDDGRDADKVRAGRHPPGPAEQRACNQSDDRQFGAAGDKGGGHNRHLAVTVVFNGTGRHNAGNAAAGADEHRDKGLTGQAELAENTVHDKRDTRHIAAGFQKRQQQEQHQHLRHKAQHRAHARRRCRPRSDPCSQSAQWTASRPFSTSTGTPGTHTPYAAGIRLLHGRRFLIRGKVHRDLLPSTLPSSSYSIGSGWSTSVACCRI